MNSAASVSFAQVLRNRQYLALWLAQAVSSFGDWLAILALFSLVTFRWKGTAYEVGGIFIAFTLPYVVVAPLAGVFVDRWNLKRTMIASDLLRAGLCVLLATASGLWQVYALLGLLSAVSCFFLPAQGAMIPLLVRREELLVANALNAQTIHLNKIIGPAAAGLLVAWAGERICFLLDAATFLASAALLAMLTTRRTLGDTHKQAAAVFHELREGWEFLWGHAVLRFVVLATVATIFAVGAFDALVAVYVRDVLRAESKIFGALVSIVGVGTILGAAVIGKRGQAWPRLFLVLGGVLGLGAGIAALATTTTWWMALAAGLFLGFAVSAVNIPSQTLTQEETPQALLGRVSSTGIAVITVAQLVAVAIAGKLAEWIGIRNLYYAVAAMLALTALAGYAYAQARHLLVSPTTKHAGPETSDPPTSWRRGNR